MELKEREEVDMEGTPQPTVHVAPPKPQDDRKNILGIAVVVGGVLLAVFFPEQVKTSVQTLATLPLELVGVAVLYLGLVVFAAATAVAFVKILWERKPWQVLAGSLCDLGSLVWTAIGIFLPTQPAQKRSLNYFELTEGPNHLPDLEKLNVLDARLEADLAAFVEQQTKTKMKGV